MTIYLRREAPGAVPLSRAYVKALARTMLEQLELESSELSILLTNDHIIRRINREFRDKDKPTDVLSFPQHEFARPMVPKHSIELAVLGDIVISLETAERQAQGRKRSVADEVRFLLAHGLLHLVGYDHMTPKDKTAMTARTRALVRATSQELDPSPPLKKAHRRPPRA